MAISSLGGVIFANQNMQIPASKQIDFQNKFDLQNVVAAKLLNEKDKEVGEVKEAEEIYKIDPDKEHEKEKSDENSGEKEKETNFTKNKIEKEIKNKQENTPYHLDIKV